MEKNYFLFFFGLFKKCNNEGNFTIFGAAIYLNRSDFFKQLIDAREFNVNKSFQILFVFLAN